MSTVRNFLAIIFAMVVAQHAYSATVVEFYNPDLDNYFITSDPGEQGFVDGGTVGLWQRTGNTFPTGGVNQACRFYGSAHGPNSHFYTADAGECAYLVSIYHPGEKSWKFESNDFKTTVPFDGKCPTNTFPVYRAYNNGNAKGKDSNHRITNNLAAIQEVVNRGWTNEGVVMCSPQAGVATTMPTCPAPQVIQDGKCAASCTGLLAAKKGICVMAPPTPERLEILKAIAFEEAAAQLKSPSSFRLVGTVNTIINKDNVSGSLNFSFDAQNSFGVYLRTYAICNIAVKDGIWKNIGTYGMYYCYVF